MTQPVHPFRNIARLATGDFVAKALNVAAFLYLARVLGVREYGVLEFAVALTSYFLFFADAGVELWAIRSVAQGEPATSLIGRVVSLRALLAALAFSLLCAVVPWLPDHPHLRVVLLLFGGTLFAQAASLKWAFMGQEQLARVAWGLLAGQALFAAGVLAAVHSPAHVLWVPVCRVIGDVAAALYFLRCYRRTHGRLRWRWTLRGARATVRPALTMGAAHGLALANYNIGSVLLGFLVGPTAVGWYNAAYRPVTMCLAMPVTYFVGLFPVLARTFRNDPATFGDLVARSLRVTAMAALPLGVGGTFLSAPIIRVLFGEAYLAAVPVLQVLAWSGVLVILRGTYRQALNAAGCQHLDLRCAALAASCNTVLCIGLIPVAGMLGAALAALTGEVLWLHIARRYFREVAAVALWPAVRKPALAASAATLWLLGANGQFWVTQAVCSGAIYLGVLALGEWRAVHGGVARWVAAHRPHVSVQAGGS